MTRMKDSGIEWIGEVPEDWGIKPIKHIFGAIGSGTTPDSSKVEYYDGNINWLQSGDLYKKDYVYAVSKTITDLGYRSSASLRIYQAPFLAIAMYGASIGNLAISKIDACVNQAVAVLKGEENIVRFAKLALEISKTELIFAAQGGTQPNINQVLIKNWVIPFPSEIEIKKIADFLDKKVAQLDKVKSLLEEQIKTLEDYRKSLIYQTVTKGLDKTVPLKDSGVDWIGQIPEGWGVKPIKYLVTYDDEVLTQSVINSNKLINYVDIGSVNLVDGISKYQELSTLDAPSRARRVAQKGDTIISTVRTYLKAIAFVEDDYIVSTGFCVLRPRKINNRYFNYAIMSNSFTELVSKYAWGVSYPAISASQLVNIPVSYPKSANEQILIADFLDKKTEQINQMIAIKKEQIENINKQRQTLIYDYVTGKRRV
ncbi:MAG: restriction endonuclease subunit S [Streptococcus suis]